MKVYMCGTISKNDEHQDWREVVSRTLTTGGHIPLDPMRGKNVNDISEDGLTSQVIPGPLFVSRDFMDIKKTDVILCVFWRGFTRQSIGTWMELGAAALLGKPIVVVTNDPDVVSHPFILRFGSLTVGTIEEGLGALAWLGIGSEFEK